MDEYFNPYGDLPEMPDMSDLSDNDRDEVVAKGTVVCLATALLIPVVLLLLLLLCGCSSVRTVDVERVRTDTVRWQRTIHDSVAVRDSIFVDRFMRGDTVFMVRDRWHTEYRDRWRTDTVYHSKTDSIPIPVPLAVEKEVQAELSWWQQVRLWTGNIVLTVLGAGIIYNLLRRRLGRLFGKQSR